MKKTIYKSIEKFGFLSLFGSIGITAPKFRFYFNTRSTVAVPTLRHSNVLSIAVTFFKIIMYFDYNYI